MASPTDIRKGRVIDYNGTPHLVLDMLFRTQGRGSGWTQVTLRNLKTGSSSTVKVLPLKLPQPNPGWSYKFLFS
ncbi:MAG: hypothetical protein O3C43_02815 [Verrucomicrobia bacterium]|nr:hypothetical protein [Verrucomicrobiota bacterium]MDA1065416.1 hypothetical protein [Verrucomicrobiota bacterium]